MKLINTFVSCNLHKSNDETVWHSTIRFTNEDLRARKKSYVGHWYKIEGNYQSEVYQGERTGKPIEEDLTRVIEQARMMGWE